LRIGYNKIYTNGWTVPIFVGIFKGKLITSYGSFYVIQTKNSYYHLELYLPGVVKSEKELSSRRKKNVKYKLRFFNLLPKRT